MTIPEILWFKDTFRLISDYLSDQEIRNAVNTTYRYRGRPISFYLGKLIAFSTAVSGNGKYLKYYKKVFGREINYSNRTALYIWKDTYATRIERFFQLCRADTDEFNKFHLFITHPEKTPSAYSREYIEKMEKIDRIQDPQRKAGSIDNYLEQITVNQSVAEARQKRDIVIKALDKNLSITQQQLEDVELQLKNPNLTVKQREQLQTKLVKIGDNLVRINKAVKGVKNPPKRPNITGAGRAQRILTTVQNYLEARRDVQKTKVRDVGKRRDELKKRADGVLKTIQLASQPTPQTKSVIPIKSVLPKVQIPYSVKNLGSKAQIATKVITTKIPSFVGGFLKQGGSTILRMGGGVLRGGGGFLLRGGGLAIRGLAAVGSGAGAFVATIGGPVAIALVAAVLIVLALSFFFPIFVNLMKSISPLSDSPLGSSVSTTSGGDTSQCTFYREGDSATGGQSGLKFNISEWPALINEVSSKVGVPASVVAGILRVECPDCFATKDPTYITNDYDEHCSEIDDQCVAYGAMQFKPETFKYTFSNNRSLMGTLFNKQAVTTDIDPTQSIPPTILRIYSIRDSVIAAAFKIKMDGGTPPYDRNAIDTIASFYYGQCEYSQGGKSFSYCDDLWKSYNECKTTTTIPITPISCQQSSGGTTVVLNPGHAINPTDPELNGAAGEAEKNTELAKKIKDRLQTKGYQTFLARPDHEGVRTFNSASRYDDYQQRIDFANDYNDKNPSGDKADLFIEIHFDAGSGGPYSFYSDRRIIVDSSENSTPNTNIVTPNVDQWIAESRRINRLITSKISSALKNKYNIDYQQDRELADHACIGRTCGGHLFTIGPQGTRSNPERPESIIQRENQAVSAYIETLGMSNSYANDLDLLADAYVEAISEYLGTPIPGSTTNQCVHPTAPNIPDSELKQAIEDKFGIVMSGFDTLQLKWAWEKFWDVSNTKFIELIHGQSRTFTINVSDASYQPTDGTGCQRNFLQKFTDETVFKVILTHELGHIIYWCNPESLAKTIDHEITYLKEGAVTGYGEPVGGQSCTSSGPAKTEDYPEMITYYLNPGVKEMTLSSKSGCVIRNQIPYGDGRYPLHFNLAKDILGSY